MSTRLLYPLLALLFVLTVCVRLPARWVIAALPAAIECELPSGSAWNGACGQLRAGTITLEGLRWQLHLWPLLRAHLDADVRSADPRIPAQALVSLAPGGHVVVRDLDAEVPVDSGFLPVLPSGWNGRLQLAFSVVELEAGRLQALQGTATARQLARRNPAMAIGSYELRFDRATGGAEPGPAMIVGELRDLDGPLMVSGRLAIRNGSDYELAGQLSARAGAGPELTKLMEFLGPADAQGRRPFSLTGTF